MPPVRPLIAFFDYHDVFEDFYPHYGVDQQIFSTRWADTANHAWLSIIQREIGDVVWHVFSVKPELSEGRHEVVGCQIKIHPSSWLHRCLWKAYYLPQVSWRWRRWSVAYRVYATVASYVAVISIPFFRTLNRERPDYLFVQDYNTGRFDVLLLLSKILGIPLLAYHSGSTPEMYLGGRIKRWTIPRADWIFPSGRSELNNLLIKFRVKRDRLAVLRPPVEMSVFHPMDRTEACRMTGLDDRRRYILFIGRFEDPIKRISNLIRAFSSLTGELRMSIF
jgi:glycosyltransferase involved in cell wall biosynthesis